MTGAAAARLQLPVTDYRTGDWHRFGTKVRARLGWATHLGDDVAVPAGTPVAAMGAGTVVQAEVRPGSRHRSNWGGLVLVQHRGEGAQAPPVFYSLYGHLRELAVASGQAVAAGQRVGIVAEGLTPENGWWRQPHLHFAVYVGPWQPGQTLPGYARWWQWGRTKKRWWRDPKAFIAEYNQKEPDNERRSSTS